MRGCKTGKHVQGLLQGFGGLLEFLFVRVIRALVKQVLGFIRRQARERKGEAQREDQDTDRLYSEELSVHNASIVLSLIHISEPTRPY